MSERDTHPGIAEALRHIAAARWFEAHEGLEEAWRPARGERRDTLQGMIHIVVALEHVRRGNPRGAQAQWSKAQRRLRNAPEKFEGIELARWHRDVADFFAHEGLADLPPSAAARAPRPRAANPTAGSAKGRRTDPPPDPKS